MIQVSPRKASARSWGTRLYLSVDCYSNWMGTGDSNVCRVKRYTKGRQSALGFAQ